MIWQWVWQLPRFVIIFTSSVKSDSFPHEACTSDFLPSLFLHLWVSRLSFSFVEFQREVLLFVLSVLKMCTDTLGNSIYGRKPKPGVPEAYDLPYLHDCWSTPFQQIRNLIALYNCARHALCRDHSCQRRHPHEPTKRYRCDTRVTASPYFVDGNGLFHLIARVSANGRNLLAA